MCRINFKKCPKIIFYNASYYRGALYSIEELKLTTTLSFEAKPRIVDTFPATFEVQVTVHRDKLLK